DCFAGFFPAPCRSRGSPTANVGGAPAAAPSLDAGGAPRLCSGRSAARWPRRPNGACNRVVARRQGVLMRRWTGAGLALLVVALVACAPAAAPAAKTGAAPAQPAAPASQASGQAPALSRDVSVRIGHVGAPSS